MYTKSQGREIGRSGDQEIRRSKQSEPGLHFQKCERGPIYSRYYDSSS